MKQTENLPKSDAEILVAVLAGDRELFRELVDRHGPAVFGVAWSRLGDRSLAEEAAQETFIQAYKRLGLLRDAQRFGAWLTAIARNIAINFGIRHRRELQKRESWKLEQASIAEETSNEPRWSSATVREALEQLPQQHRETLVLFYIEGKSIAEAAGAAGISPTAFKTRLHRARESMRAALETQLAESLENLKPSSNFSAAVMLALPAQAPTAAFGTGAFAALLKAIPSAWVLFFLQFVSLIPGIFYARWLLKKDRENFRDPQGFRARNVDRMRRTATWFVPILFLGIVMVARPIGATMFFAVLLCAVGLPTLVWSVRRLTLVRSRQTTVEALAALFVVAFCVSMQFDLPSYWIFYFNAALFATLSVTLGRRPMRMDYSLFQRAAEESEAIGNTPVEGKEYSRQQLLDFARFLFERQLAWDWKWNRRNLELKLSPVTPRAYLMLFPLLWRGYSILSIAPNGEIAARMGAFAARDLKALEGGQKASELEKRVSLHSARALEALANNRIPAAEALLWHCPEDRIFRKAPDQTLSSRAIVWTQRACALLFLGIGLFAARDYWSGRRFSLEPVRYTESEFRHHLQTTLLDTRGTNAHFEGPFKSAKLPERQFFSPAAIDALHALLRNQMRHYSATNPVQRGTDFFLADELFHRVFNSGLITTNDLPQFGIVLADVEREIRSWPDWRKRMHLNAEPIHIGQLSYTVLNTRQLSTRIPVLTACGLLDLFDGSPVVEAIVERQIIAERTRDDRWLDLDTKQLRGLFLMIHANPIRDTYDSLVVLENLRALDRIDREECIRGILRLHLGRGLFQKKETAGSQNWNVRGDAEDTFCAWESLRILGALDRVDDHEKWLFRSQRYAPNDLAVPPWEKLQAYALHARALRGRQN